MEYKDKAKSVSEKVGNLYKKRPELRKTFGSLHGYSLQEGEVSTKNKELVALGIAIAIRCEDCIVSHVQASKRAGVTLEEIYETIEVAVMMGGGPSIMYGSRAAACAEELYK